MFNILAVALLGISLLADHGFAVNVPFSSCSSTTKLTIQSVTADAWPPIKGDMLSLNVSGQLDESVSAGKYEVTVKLDGIKLPIVINGSINDFKPLPWSNGALSFTYNQSIPSSTPSGSYLVQINAQDQDGSELICLQIAFKEKMINQPINQSVNPKVMIKGDTVKHVHKRPTLTIRGESINPTINQSMRRHAPRRLGRTLIDNRHAKFENKRFMA